MSRLSRLLEATAPGSGDRSVRPMAALGQGGKLARSDRAMAPIPGAPTQPAAQVLSHYYGLTSDACGRPTARRPHYSLISIAMRDGRRGGSVIPFLQFLPLRISETSFRSCLFAGGTRRFVGRWSSVRCSVYRCGRPQEGTNNLSSLLEPPEPLHPLGGDLLALASSRRCMNR